MAHLFTFDSGQFLEANERPNPINPIAGEGVLKWLSAQLADRGFDVGAPDAEDWGWYTHVVTSGRTYLLGASGEWEPNGGRTEWAVQLELSRSLWEKLSGSNELAADDAVSIAIEASLKANAELGNVLVERDA